MMLTTCIGLVLFSHGSSVGRMPAPSDMVPLDSAKGKSMLQEASSELDSFVKIIPQFQTQQTQTFCGVATGATILNSLPNVTAPVDTKFTPYHYFTQDDIFNNTCVLNVASREKILMEGMSLDTFHNVMNCWLGIDRAQITYAGKSSVAAFRLTASMALSNGDFVAINFHRTEVGEVGGGHFSPVACYAPSSDSFLLLDVSRYKYPAAWVSTKDLFDAMNTMDSGSEVTRGWVIIH